MSKPIIIKQFVDRWYLYWAKSGKTIASFATQFEAYSARRAIMEHNKKGEIL